MKPYTKKLVLEDGREFPGVGFASDVESIGELVFNTSMVGFPIHPTPRRSSS